MAQRISSVLTTARVWFHLTMFFNLWRTFTKFSTSIGIHKDIREMEPQAINNLLQMLVDRIRGNLLRSWEIDILNINSNHPAH